MEEVDQQLEGLSGLGGLLRHRPIASGEGRGGHHHEKEHGPKVNMAVVVVEALVVVVVVVAGGGVVGYEMGV